jgi:hypothetical protein
LGLYYYMNSLVCLLLFSFLWVPSLLGYTRNGNPGPWGDLIISNIYLEAPDSVIEVVGKPDPTPRWVFSGLSASAVKDLLIQSGVELSLVDRLTSPAQLKSGSNEIIVYPKLEDLLQIKGVVRDKLYNEISKFPQNEYYVDPVFILSGDVEEWLSEATLNASQKDVIRQLVWRRGKAIVFSNVGVLMNYAQTSEEIKNTLRAITRCMTLVVNEKFPLKQEQREVFLRYWLANQPESPRMTFIKAISKENDINDTVDVMHFLPVIMREKLYTFPSLKDGAKGRLPDCHWTSLNFFNLSPRDYYRNTSLAAIQLTQSYNQVSPPYQFGDVLCFTDNGDGLHTCVYIADNIVLTKNGENILAPWVMLTVEDVSKIYKRTPTTQIQGYRLK